MDRQPLAGVGVLRSADDERDVSRVLRHHLGVDPGRGLAVAHRPDAQGRIDVHSRCRGRLGGGRGHDRQRRARRSPRRADRCSNHSVCVRHLGRASLHEPTAGGIGRSRCPDGDASLLRRAAQRGARAVGNHDRRPGCVRLRTGPRLVEHPSVGPIVAAGVVPGRRRAVRLGSTTADRARIAGVAVGGQARCLGSRLGDGGDDPSRRRVARHRTGRPHTGERNGRRRPARRSLGAARRSPRSRDQPRIARRHPHLGRRVGRAAVDGLQRCCDQPERRSDQRGRGCNARPDDHRRRRRSCHRCGPQSEGRRRSRGDASGAPDCSAERPATQSRKASQAQDQPSPQADGRGAGGRRSPDRAVDTRHVEERAHDGVHRTGCVHAHRRPGPGRVRHDRRQPGRRPLEPRSAGCRPGCDDELHRRRRAGCGVTEAGPGRRHHHRAVRDRLRQHRRPIRSRSRSRPTPATSRSSASARSPRPPPG